MPYRSIPVFIFLFACAGCASDDGTAFQPKEPAVILAASDGPEGAAPGSCWGKIVQPAIIETKTVQELISSEVRNSDGSIKAPAAYATRTVQEIVQDRSERFFETLCPDQLTPEFVASLQRALKARALYRGPITGEMDQRTRNAIRLYQKPAGLDSGILSLETGRAFGLIRTELT